MDYLIWIWVAVACASAAIEFLSMQLVAVWFTFSSIVTIILALCGVVWWVQVLVFCVLALVLLLALRKFSLKYLLKNDTHTTNVDSVVGTQHKLLESIEPEKPGSLKINGVVWTAVCVDENQTLDAGEFVEIVKVSGNKLLVKTIEKEQTEEVEEDVTEEVNPKKSTSTTKKTSTKKSSTKPKTSTKKSK